MFQEFAGPVMRPEQALESFEHGFIAHASVAEKLLTRVLRADSERLLKNGFLVVHLRIVRRLAAKKDQRSSKPLNFLKQPSSGVGPIPFGRRRGYVEHLCCFLQAQAGEEAQLNQLGFHWVGKLSGLDER